MIDISKSIDDVVVVVVVVMMMIVVGDVCKERTKAKGRGAHGTLCM
jgi:hypothetical protein